MDHRTQVDLAQQLLRHIDAGTTALADGLLENPVEIFTSREKLEQEKQELFLRYPQPMGLSCMLPEPNTYVADDYSGVPVLLTRDQAGAAHAFLNVCRHRGAQVAQGQGSCGHALKCPYHGWAYKSDGSLAGVPDRKSFDGLCAERNSLAPLPLVEKDGILWLGLDRHGQVDVEAHLSNLAPELASYDLASYHHYGTRILHQNMNWKIAVDTFLEPYHFSTLHKTTVAPILMSNLCLVDGFGPHVREVFPRHTIDALRALPRQDWDLLTHSAVLYLLFPNAVFVYQIDHVEFWRIYPDPHDTDKCVVVFEFYIPEPAVTEKARLHWDKNLDLTLRTVENEDFPTGEGIQRGCRTGAQEAVVYGRNEPALQYFHKQLRAAHAAA